MNCSSADQKYTHAYTVTIKTLHTHTRTHKMNGTHCHNFSNIHGICLKSDFIMVPLKM